MVLTCSVVVLFCCVDLFLKPSTTVPCCLCFRAVSSPGLPCWAGSLCPARCAGVRLPGGFGCRGAPAFPWDSRPAAPRGFGRRLPKLEATLGRGRWPRGWSRTEQRLHRHKCSNLITPKSRRLTRCGRVHSRLACGTRFPGRACRFPGAPAPVCAPPCCSPRAARRGAGRGGGAGGARARPDPRARPEMVQSCFA